MKIDFTRLGIAVLFMAIVLFYVYNHSSGIDISSANGLVMLLIAALFGAYMAVNIGANDVANNMGPSVGSKALTMGAAIAIAATFEVLGAVIVGGEVVSTIKTGIIDSGAFENIDIFIWIMLSALLAGALWLNVATIVGAPVSTTHSIVGAVMGAGIVAGGMDVVNWSKIGSIVSSWAISPVMGGAIAAVLLYTIKRTITYKPQMLEAASRVVPLLIAFMVWVFSSYLLIKTVRSLSDLPFIYTISGGFVLAVIVFFVIRPLIRTKIAGMENSKEGVNSLFTLPLIISAALLSFAHGANDVANAIGPLAAIYEAVAYSSLDSGGEIPIWILLVGAGGLALGLMLYGPRLIATVGGEITDLDKMRAFCIAIASAFTVVLASQLGLPISTTHVAIGAVFGVGFLREYLKKNYAKMEQFIIDSLEGEEVEKIERYLARFNAASLRRKAMMIAATKKKAKKLREKGDPKLSKKNRKILKKAYKKELVKRSMMIKIVAAWVITVPATALIAALIYKIIESIFA